MIDPANIYHTGIAVKDIEAAKAFYETALGYQFAPDHLYEPLKLWRADMGWTEEWLRVTYSREGPHHLELVEGAQGGFWDPEIAPNNAQHVGFWCDNLPSAIGRLTSGGWTFLASRGHPDEGYGDFAYLANDQSHAAIELVSFNAKERITAWFSEV